MHGDLPDIWNLAPGTWAQCSATPRLAPEAAQEDPGRSIKALAPKPVVGVGRFTSPDEMVRQIRTGVLDFIGVARPSIAGPFLPMKIDQGRSEDIRECGGGNFCVSETVLISGGGPTGLEAALQLGRRGYTVTLAEATKALGGRAAAERRLAGRSGDGWCLMPTTTSTLGRFRDPLTQGCGVGGEQAGTGDHPAPAAEDRGDDPSFHGTRSRAGGRSCVGLHLDGARDRSCLQSVKLIGDAVAPGPIAWAIYAGRRYAEELDEPDRGDALSFQHEITELSGR